jgi:hypothetical protein
MLTVQAECLPAAWAEWICREDCPPERSGGHFFIEFSGPSGGTMTWSLAHCGAFFCQRLMSYRDRAGGHRLEQEFCAAARSGAALPK